jgi:hypothetical protein
MSWIPFTPGSSRLRWQRHLAHQSLANQQNQGLTLTEVLVGSIVSLIVMGIAFSGAMFNRNLFLQDQTRNTVNQNLRTALDILGSDLQQVGEGLGTVVAFPALQVTTGGVGTSSEIIIRRQALNRPLTVCQDVAAGSVDPLIVAIPGSLTPGCAPDAVTSGSGWPDNISAWRNYRLDSVANGTTARGFIFNGADLGESFTYSLEDRFPNDPTGSFRIFRASGNWSGDYRAGIAILSIVEERRYRLCPEAQITQPNCTAQAGQDNILHVIVNGDLANPVQLTNGIDQFNVQVSERDPATPTAPTSTVSDFCWQGGVQVSPIPAAPNACGAPTPQHVWNRITSIAVTLRGLNSAPSDLIGIKQDQATRLLTKQFFPRNALSR